MKNFLNKENFHKFISIDIETTGLNFHCDKIIEIAAHKFVDGRIQDSYKTLINPNQNLNSFIIELTGINNEMLINQPTFQEIEEDFLNFIDDCPLVGHNIIFDLNFLSHFSPQFKKNLNIDKACDTYILSKIFCYSLSSFSLQSMCKYYEIDIKLLHRADIDALNCGKLFLKLLDEITKNNISLIQETSNYCKRYKIPNGLLLENIINYMIQYDNENIITDSRTKFNNINYVHKSKGVNKFQDIESIFKNNNLLSSKFINYEYRKNQEQLSIDILSAFNNSNYLIADAGAGIGKTYAYLVAAIYHIKKSNSKCIISTNTHSLQQQLFLNDIPNIIKALDVSCNVVLAKGSNNYICLNRFKHLIQNNNISLNQEEYLELVSLILWSNETLSGDISECNSFSKIRFIRLWNLISYNAFHCSKGECRENGLCFYSKVMNHIKASEIVIVNHALLINNFEREDFMISDESICVIDEAHNFNSVCKEQLTQTLSLNSFNILKDKLISLQSDNKYLIKKAKYKIVSNLYNDIELIYRDLCKEVEQSVDYDQINQYGSNYTYNFNNIKFSANFSNLHILIGSIEDFKTKILDFKDGNKILDDLLNEIKKIESKIDYIFFNVNEKVIWINYSINKEDVFKMKFNASPLVLDKIINRIYDKFNSILFTSATIAIDDNFDFFTMQMSLNNHIYNNKAISKTYQSPYYYSDQSKLFIINSDKDINDFEYMRYISSMIVDINNQVKDKRMLVLCTSFKQINDFKKIIVKTSKEVGNYYFQTKGLSRELLLKSYLNNNNSVLFGTNTFWEGIDLPKDKLEILLIFKLPFSNPSNPFVKANIKFYENNNLNPFFEYQLPEAIIKLKQGLGRLIRSHSDMGVCILTDPRINKKMYGQKIVDSFPIIPFNFTNVDSIIHKMNKFFSNK